jgi:Zn finger protein HypA/HybF involved in hydrogenase expression
MKGWLKRNGMDYLAYNMIQPVCKCSKCNAKFRIEEIIVDEEGHKTSPCCGSNEFKVIPSQLDLFLDKYLSINSDEKYYEY